MFTRPALKTLAGYGTIETIEIERSAARHRHVRASAECVRPACAQRTRDDIRRSAVAVGSRECGAACKHIDSPVAADRGGKHVAGRGMIEVDRAGASAKCDARRSGGCRVQPPDCPRSAPTLRVPIAPTLFAITTGMTVHNAPLRNRQRAGARVANIHPRNCLLHVEPAPATLTVPREPAPLPMLAAPKE